jgi:hypothetical protein
VLLLPLTEREGREAAVATRGRRAATAACAAAIVVLGIFATPALASDGTSTPTAVNATEVPSGTAEAASPGTGEVNGNSAGSADQADPGNQPNEANNQPNQASSQPNQANDGEGPAGESNSPQPVDAEQPAAGESLAADAVDDTNRATASGQGPNTNDNGHAPEHQGSTATTITQQAEAGAVATQEGASNSTTTSSGESQTGGGVAQGNGASADATASTDASVALEQQPGAGSANGQLNNDDSTDVVLTTDLTQSVGATAEVHQGGATNTSIVVRNDAPGDDGPVSQANTAGATASGSAIGTTAGNAGLSDAPSSSSDVSQDVQAGAIATQSDVANTNVSVRVGSAGDSGTVSQANTATATAAAQASDTTAATQAQSTARQDGAANTNVSVRVFSPGDDGAVTQANAANASATAVDSAAQAGQTCVSNTNVSIRINSPGSEGGAAQGSSSATATDGPESAETAAKIFDVECHDGNTDVRISVNHPDLADPTSNSAGLVTVWQWTWQWDYDEALGLPFDLDQAGPGWDWNWTVTSVPLTPDLTPGTFTWSWDWERDGDWTWTWDLSAPLSCNDCVWIWNWTWTWEGSSVDADGTAPAVDGTAPAALDGTGSAAPAATSTAVAQQNIATAVAEASVLADVSQASIHDDGAGISFAGQFVDLAQLARADASAIQSDTLNELVTPGTQANVARADAIALGDALMTQEVVQARGGPKETSQWAGQQIGVRQILAAQAVASQSDARNLGSSRTTLAVADAGAFALAETSQQLDQVGLSLGGTQDQWAGQQTSLAQTAAAVALVDQSGARDGASALASSSAAAKATTIQGAEQKAIGGFGLRSQRSAQLVFLNQVGASTATTTTDSTSGHTNREASSKAMTLNDGLVEQRAAQELTEAGPISIQDATQETLLVQVADAYSPSLGGTAGTATVVNRAAVGQASGQGMGGFPPEPTTAPAEPGEEGQTLDAGVQATTIVRSTAVLAAALDVEPRGGYGVYVGVDRGRPERSAVRGYARGSSLTVGGPLAPPLGAFAPVARTPQVSVAIVPASPSGHDSKAAVRDHTEPPLQWPCGLLMEVGSAGSIVPGGGNMAAAIVASLPAIPTGWRLVAGSVIKRPTHFTLRPERPG